MGQKVFITGASSGLGLAMAQQFAQNGATLALIGRRQDALETLRDSLVGSHEIYALDVNDEKALHAAAHDFMLKHGLPDVVVAAAGISVGTLSEVYEDLEQIRRVIQTNVFALTSTFHPFISPMKAAGKGTLVGIASVAAIRGLPGAGAYCASKAAVVQYCESLRVELHGTGVKVTTILPGYIDTPMTRENPYTMPFLMKATDFASRAVAAIDAQKSYTVIPWQMGVVAKLLRVLPNWLYDKAFSGRKRKPRANE
ncbi:SDR family oxidoreductase [Hydromonas duriensis]|uniref:Short-subunit dehydrogenase n=1 Tax=Hydromonas duriensis TaxID=1527608 RepID=A0A4R6Y6A2_9BURK|nr:SDR family oxidoreductase [Hydromonas duriensis]TDR30998.1 short-subunit dehydrogenase [Hydromonas duriensis]